MEELKITAEALALEFIEKARLKKGDIVVVGCSSSEICGARIGHGSDPQAAKLVFEGLYKPFRENGIYLAAQCCEHLNRTLIVENEYAKSHFLDRVNVIPQPKAGGSFATAAYSAFDSPCAVEHIRADGGIDIGDTLIGMHIREVCVPLRTDISQIGFARVVCARTRPKYVGGSRAVYDENLE